jgi:cell division septation protein DedD
VGGGYYLYTNFDFNSLLPEKSKISEQIIPEDVVVQLQYSLNFGEAKHLVLLSSFGDESLAKSLVEQKITEGYAANYFFLPSVSNSNEQIYRVYLGPYFSQSEAKQWAGTLEDESEILNL